jgi:hypothetical protein
MRFAGSSTCNLADRDLFSFLQAPAQEKENIPKKNRDLHTFRQKLEFALLDDDTTFDAAVEDPATPLPPSKTGNLKMYSVLRMELED